jgi:hypothetical protein
MSSDNRTVATDALETLGTIIGENEKRDAIHLAVEPAVAGHYLRPGDHVGFLNGGTLGICDNPLGIVDPFLKSNVKTGQRFWLVLYPRGITSLRHVWTHPAFDGATPPATTPPSETTPKPTDGNTGEFGMSVPKPIPDLSPEEEIEDEERNCHAWCNG